MNSVTILPVVADDGELVWRTPHFKMPFLRPKTFYTFKVLTPDEAITIRVVSAWYVLEPPDLSALEPPRIYFSKLLDPDKF